MATISVVIIFVMMISISADVAMRFLADSPIVGVVELNRTLLVVVVFFTVGYAQVRKQHINVLFLINKMSSRRQTLIMALNTTLALVIVALITYGAIKSAYISTAEGGYEVGLLNYPIWTGRIAMAMGLFVLCFQYVSDIASGVVSYFKGGKVS